MSIFLFYEIQISPTTGEEGAEVLILYAVVAVAELPSNDALIVAGNFKVTAELPFTLVAGPELVESLSEIVKFLAVDHAGELEQEKTFALYTLPI